MKIVQPAFTAVFFLVLCVNTVWADSTKFDLGRIEDGVFINDYFNCSLKIPEGWSAKFDTNQELYKKALAETQKEMEQHNRYFDTSLVESAILVMITRYPQGTPVKFNPNILIMVEKVSAFPGIRTGADYLYHTSGLMRLMGNTKIKGKKFDKHGFSKTFYSMDLITKVYGLKVRQTMFSTITKGFALSLICSYDTKKQKAELVEAVSGIEFYE